MKKKINFKIIGGDLRQVTIANSLSKEGHKVKVMGFDENYKKDFTTEVLFDKSDDERDVVLLPLPYSRDGITIRSPLFSEKILLEDIIINLDKNNKIYAGKVDNKLKKICEEKSIPLVDYFLDEKLKVENSVLAAEAAIAIGIYETKIAIANSRILITGYGRIGKNLARLLKAFNPKLTVATNDSNEELWSRVSGNDTIKLSSIPKIARELDTIFNTIPSNILNEDCIKPLKKDVAIIEIASSPGGIDRKLIKEFDLNIISAPSLPGRFSPIDAGLIIKDSIMKDFKSQNLKKELNNGS